ncbi:SLIT and NTRK-like protein 6 [Anneissia japonica]|uniref:SLIT and NTRK-like protein 6 n=1 Tax=Anneissia japonica TaxID=1529436 RepID=UPI0014259F46|nr:SLIT and NTRK-like protein 6 [Anneissia japonica]
MQITAFLIQYSKKMTIKLVAGLTVAILAVVSTLAYVPCNETNPYYIQEAIPDSFNVCPRIQCQCVYCLYHNFNYSFVRYRHIVTCDKKGIISVPSNELPADTVVLKMRNNMITGLSSNSFPNTTETLLLGLNELVSEKIHADAFSNLMSLTHLQMDYNRNITFINQNWFRNLFQLTHLHLEMCGITKIVPNAFLNLNALQLLNLAGNKIKDIPPNLFQKLTSLTTLNLDSNSIKVLPDAMFHGTDNLTLLALHRNSLTTITKTVGLQNLLMLTSLSLFDNPYNCDCDLEWFHYWLREENSTNILKNIQLIDCGSPQSLKSKQVAEIDFEVLCGGSIPDAHWWVILAASLGALVLLCLFVFIGIKYRKYRILYADNRISLSSKAKMKKTQIELLGLTAALLVSLTFAYPCSDHNPYYINNSIPDSFKVCPKPCSCPYCLYHKFNKTLLRYRHAVECDGKDIHSVSSHELPADTAVVKMSSNKITGLSANSFPNTTETIVLTKNRLTSGQIHDDAFSNLRSLTRLRMDDNQNITFINQNWFRNLFHLTHLNIEICGITEIFPNAFLNLNALQLLNLTGNKIEHIPPNLFKNLTSLTTLNLDTNSIKVLPDAMFHGTDNLTLLALHRNSLTTITETVGLQNLLMLTSLSLFDNPYNCDCDLEWFHYWLREENSTDILKNIQSIDCGSPQSLESKQVVEIDFDEFECGRSFLDAYWWVILAATLGALVLLCLFVIIGIKYRKYRIGHQNYEVVQ